MADTQDPAAEDQAQVAQHNNLVCVNSRNFGPGAGKGFKLRFVTTNDELLGPFNSGGESEVWIHATKLSPEQRFLAVAYLAANPNKPCHPTLKPQVQSHALPDPTINMDEDGADGEVTYPTMAMHIDEEADTAAHGGEYAGRLTSLSSNSDMGDNDAGDNDAGYNSDDDNEHHSERDSDNESDSEYQDYNEDDLNEETDEAAHFEEHTGRMTRLPFNSDVGDNETGYNSDNEDEDEDDGEENENNDDEPFEQIIESPGARRLAKGSIWSGGELPGTKLPGSFPLKRSDTGSPSQSTSTFTRGVFNFAQSQLLPRSASSSKYRASISPSNARTSSSSDARLPSHPSPSRPSSPPMAQADTSPIARSLFRASHANVSGHSQHQTRVAQQESRAAQLPPPFSTPPASSANSTSFSSQFSRDTTCVSLNSSQHQTRAGQSPSPPFFLQNASAITSNGLRSRFSMNTTYGPFSSSPPQEKCQQSASNRTANSTGTGATAHSPQPALGGRLPQHTTIATSFANNNPPAAATTHNPQPVVGGGRLPQQRTTIATPFASNNDPATATGSNIVEQLAWYHQEYLEPQQKTGQYDYWAHS